MKEIYGRFVEENNSISEEGTALNWMALIIATIDEEENQGNYYLNKYELIERSDSKSKLAIL